MPKLESIRSGVAWVTVCSATSRLINIFASFAVAWYLSADDFATFGVAATVAAFCEVISHQSLSTILISRQRHFEEWAPFAASLSLAMGVAVVALLLAAAILLPNADLFESYKALTPTLIVISFSPLVSAFGVVPATRLKLQMQFRRLSGATGISNLAGSLSKIFLAACGFGPLCFALSLFVQTFIYVALCTYMCKRPQEYNWDWKKWRHFLRDAAFVLGTAIALKVITFGDYAVLSLLGERTELGLYFFAFNLSVMSIVTLTTGLASVLLPAFSRMQSKFERQEKFLHYASLIAVVMVPLCFVQAGVARDVISLAFGNKWINAVTFIEVLSIGMAARTTSWIAASYLDACGEFRIRFLLTSMASIVFLIMVISAVNLGGGTGLAISVAAFYPLLSIALSSYVLKDFPQGLVLAPKLVIVPYLLCFVAFISARALVNATAISEIPRLCLFSAIFFSIYIAFGFKVMPNEAKTIFNASVRPMHSHLQSKLGHFLNAK
ncbi:oligosaccharide flippase family protein [Crateriforma conspicua]|uniref:Teichuronic acid biosynthesis protein TuaB n=1 Tax=Crateriforma conspicua TaxID=2527996 RepID=A0A5C5Y255_9PLAN|nr:oligosaccharide flippase family protein [Crateriforma conspicua]TWT69068.1 Teichuronic acid biosynthesis protein TuaB [Crateriforma conspicua]